MRPVAWLLLLISACAVGPDYQRPALDLPEQFRDGKQAEAESAALWPWWTIFGDQDLQALLRAALSEGYDLRIAIARVEQARQQLLQARAGFFPAFNYGAFAGHGKNAFLLGTPAPTGTSADFFALSANASWEIDIWGRVRRLNEAARAQYLASQDARRDVTVSIVAEVAQNYFQLVALDRQLAIAIESRNSFAESLDIFNERLAGGVASKLETSSAAALLDTAAASIPDYERRIAAQENLLCFLVGRNPGPIARRQAGLDESRPAIPAGLPSVLLERRPDIRSAEQQLRAANAQVGVAEADFFPRLSLTGLFGTISTQLSNLFSHSALAWSAGGNLTGPLFQGGGIRARHRQALAVRQQVELQYRQVVLNALQEVASQLVARQKLTEARLQQERAVAAYRDAVKIAFQRFRLGTAAYFEVLQVQQQLFPAETNLAQIQLNEHLALVQLYRALGGGWTE
jgi:multidrug efflux system outer membrane protein